MASAILRPERNVWRIEQARRAAVLSDAAEYFSAARQTFIRAQRRIRIVGWDIDSRTRLAGADEPDDGFPVGLADFLSELVRQRPNLRIDLLLWDFSVLYAAERELLPRLSLQWRTPDQITLCLDNCSPLGCSQHQKIVTVDDAVAFSGGLDLTIRRWDTPEHDPADDRRVDPDGKPYRPFHDVQMAVDGEAAAALADIAARRWQRATGVSDAPVAPEGDPWPDNLEPDFEDVRIGISRTVPGEGPAAVNEVEHLFLDSIDAAERCIYIENQFVTEPAVAKRLARRLRQNKSLEAVIVTPREHETWFESRIMQNARNRFVRKVRRAGKDRVRFLYPRIDGPGGETETMVHSKVMAVDDRLLRIGSANLNNRSMGADTECDLVIEAANARQRKAIVDIRNRLMAEHCGVDAGEISRYIESEGSLRAATDSLSGRGHSLCPISVGKAASGLGGLLEAVGDPRMPLSLGRLWSVMSRQAGMAAGKGAWMTALAALALVVLTLAWQYTPLSDYAGPEAVRELAAGLRESSWGPLLVLALFVGGGLVAFPVIVLILATAMAFGPWLGFAYSFAGVIASALLTYAIGMKFGRDAMRSMLGRKLDSIRARVARRGLFAVAAIRMVPVAPFTVVNLAAGASDIRPVDYTLGTMLGMLPGLVALSALGSEMMRMFNNPTPGTIALFAAAAAAWIAVSFGAQALVTRLQGETS